MTDPTSLDNLRDIIVPAPLGFWPPAPGWYVVAFVLGVVSAWYAVTGVLRWQANRYRREALAELARIEKIPWGEALPPGLVCKPLPELVKRTALAAYGRETVASLMGKAWLVFLDNSLSTTEFTEGSGQLLLRIAYQRPETLADVSPTERGQLLSLIKTWVKHHNVT